VIGYYGVSPVQGHCCPKLLVVALVKSHFVLLHVQGHRCPKHPVVALVKSHFVLLHVQGHRCPKLPAVVVVFVYRGVLPVLVRQVVSEITDGLL
jgi:hypothetical protein